MTGLFNVLALLYIGRAIQLAIHIGRRWDELRQEPLTRAKQHLAEQAAFFVAVPPSVLVHEFAHALAVWLFGGQVVEFGYRVFWGYVRATGTFTPFQAWFIALAGTLGSLAFGAAIWFLLRPQSSRTLRYFGLRAFRFQIYFSLLYYPIFSLFLPIGDWRTIYDFAATPLLSGVTAVIHVALLVWFYRADRAGAFEMPAFDSLAAQNRYVALTASADPTARLEAVQMLRQGGAAHQARRELDRFLIEYPQSADGHLQRALLLAQGHRTVGSPVVGSAQRALALGLARPDDTALARRLVALAALERGDGRAAERELDAALSPTANYNPEELSVVMQAELHSLRAQALRRQARYEDAYRAAGAALKLAEEAGMVEVAQRCRAEQELIQTHAGRDLSALAGENETLVALPGMKPDPDSRL